MRQAERSAVTAQAAKRAAETHLSDAVAAQAEREVQASALAADVASLRADVAQQLEHKSAARAEAAELRKKIEGAAAGARAAARAAAQELEAQQCEAAAARDRLGLLQLQLETQAREHESKLTLLVRERERERMQRDCLQPVQAQQQQHQQQQQQQQQQPVALAARDRSATGGGLLPEAAGADHPSHLIEAQKTQKQLQQKEAELRQLQQDMLTLQRSRDALADEMLAMNQQMQQM